MIKINNKPILVHIMEHYAYTYGFKDFIVALGYKGSIIKNILKQINMTGI